MLEFLDLDFFFKFEESFYSFCINVRIFRPRFFFNMFILVTCFLYILCVFVCRYVNSVPSRVRNLRKMQNFWANFTDFEPEINIIKCKTEKLKEKT